MSISTRVTSPSTPPRRLSAVLSLITRGPAVVRGVAEAVVVADAERVRVVWLVDVEPLGAVAAEVDRGRGAPEAELLVCLERALIGPELLVVAGAEVGVGARLRRWTRAGSPPSPRMSSSNRSPGTGCRWSRPALPRLTKPWYSSAPVTSASHPPGCSSRPTYQSSAAAGGARDVGLAAGRAEAPAGELDRARGRAVSRAR